MIRTLDGNGNPSSGKQKSPHRGKNNAVLTVRDIYGTGHRPPSGKNGIGPAPEESGQDDDVRGRSLVRGSVMSLGTVVFMLGVIALITTMLIYYITIQAEVKRTSQEIAGMEEELTQIRAENDAAYNEINDSISLDEVRERAIHELGMKYANRDQVVVYSGEEEDTVHQVMEAGGR